MSTRLKRTRLMSRVLATSVLSLAVASPFAVAQTTGALPASALQQINELTAEKDNRTAAQRKISSSLLYTAKTQRGLPITASIQSLGAAVPVAADGRVSIEIAGRATKAVVEAIEQAGGRVLAGSGLGGAIRALVPLDALENIAAIPDVRAIHPAMGAITQHSSWTRRVDA